MSRCYFPDECPPRTSSHTEPIFRPAPPKTPSTEPIFRPAPPRTLSTGPIFRPAPPTTPSTNPNLKHFYDLSRQIKEDLRQWIREKAYHHAFLRGNGRFLGQIRLHNMLCSSLTAKMIHIGLDASDVREELLHLIEHEGLIAELMREESRRMEGVLSGTDLSAALPVPPDEPAVVMWIKRTAKEVAFWDKSHNGFVKGAFIGEIRLYNRLVDRLPDLRTKIKPPAGGYRNNQIITKTLVRMISQGYIEELEAEGKLRQKQNQQGGMFDQKSVGTSDESNSSTRATQGTHIEQSSFSMKKKAKHSPMFDNTRVITQEKDTTGYRNIFHSVHSKSRCDFTDAPKTIDDTSASCCATIATSCSEYTSRLREIDAKSITIPDLGALPPISIPANIQHPILRCLQRNLEIAFFEYAQKYYPDFLVSNDLTHAQAVTLNIWTAMFHKACSNGEISLGTRDLRSVTVIFEDLDELYEASVKRLILDGTRLTELTASAAYTMKYLGDQYRAERVKEISLAFVTACTDDIANRFTKITHKLQDTMEKIAMERKRLDNIEEKVKRRLEGEMKELVERMEGSLREEIGSLGILGRAAI